MACLVYKRTHEGDPGPDGVFGVFDCMGQVRGWEYDAVIGVGGMSRAAKRAGIAGQVTWIGIGPRKAPAPDGHRGPLVTFDHFVYFRGDRPDFRAKASTLAERIYAKHGRRFVLDGVSEREQEEIDSILTLAASAPSSPARNMRRAARRKTGVCGSRRC